MANFSFKIYAINVTVSKYGIPNIKDTVRSLGAFTIESPLLKLETQMHPALTCETEEHPYGSFEVCGIKNQTYVAQSHQVIEHTIEHYATKVMIE